MKFLCNHCGSTFGEPKYFTFIDDSWTESRNAHTECLCPVCGSDNIEGDVRPCDLCGAPKRSDAVVCDNCKREFLVKLNAFIDELSAQEVALLDQFTDGNSFEDVKKWR